MGETTPASSAGVLGPGRLAVDRHVVGVLGPGHLHVDQLTLASSADVLGPGHLSVDQLVLQVGTQVLLAIVVVTELGWSASLACARAHACARACARATWGVRSHPASRGCVAAVRHVGGGEDAGQGVSGHLAAKGECSSWYSPRESSLLLPS